MHNGLTDFSSAAKNNKTVIRKHFVDDETFVVCNHQCALIDD